MCRRCCSPSIITGLIGVVIERVFYRRLTSAGGGYTVAGMGMVIVGFGMSIVLQNVAFLIWGPKPFPFPVPFGRPIEIGELTLPMSYVWIVVTGAHADARAPPCAAQDDDRPRDPRRRA